MAQKKEKRVIHRLPRGPFIYPKLAEPDFGSDDYPCPEGKFEVKVRLTAEQAAPYIKKCDELAAKSLAEAKKNDKRNAGQKKKTPWETKYLPYEAELDDEGDETGNFLFKANTKHSGESKKTGKTWKRWVPLFDANGTPIPRKDLQIWGGTEGIVAFSYQPYASSPTTGASVKLSLEAVQILSLVNGAERDASEFGFGQEDGYTADAMPEGADDEEDEDTEADEDDGDEDEGDF